MTENSTQDAAPVADEVQVEVKGPDPEVWGADEERPSVGDIGAEGAAPGEILREGEEDELKGPDPEVWG